MEAACARAEQQFHRSFAASAGFRGEVATWLGEVQLVVLLCVVKLVEAAPGPSGAGVFTQDVSGWVGGGPLGVWYGWVVVGVGERVGGGGGVLMVACDGLGGRGLGVLSGAVGWAGHPADWLPLRGTACGVHSLAHT